MRSMMLAIGCLCLAGCAGWTEESAYGSTKLDKDEFRKTAVVRGPDVRLDGTHSASLSMGLAGMQPMLFFSSMQDGWIFYNSSTDSEGRNLPTTVADRIPGKICAELLRIDVDRGVLENAAKTVGYTIRVYGKYDTYTFTLPAPYISGWLRKADDLKKESAKK